MTKYELWHSEQEVSYTFCEAGRAHQAFLPADARCIWTVEADSWEEAQTQKHIYLGWEPYKPMIDPQLCVSVISAAEKTRDWNDPELPPQFNEIVLSGNREGLRWLAAQILDMADAEPGIHNHLDREAHAPIYRSEDDWWLTIGIEPEEG